MSKVWTLDDAIADATLRAANALDAKSHRLNTQIANWLSELRSLRGHGQEQYEAVSDGGPIEPEPCGLCHMGSCECLPVGNGMFQVSCPDCFMRGPRYPSREEAIAEWNRLAALCWSGRRIEEAEDMLRMTHVVEAERNWLLRFMPGQPCDVGISCPFSAAKQHEDCERHKNKKRCWRAAAKHAATHLSAVLKEK